jgi:hypothetical protein
VRWVPVVAVRSSGSDILVRLVAVDGQLGVLPLPDMGQRSWRVVVVGGDGLQVWWWYITWTEVWWLVLRAALSSEWVAMWAQALSGMCAREVRVTHNADAIGA